MSAAAGWLLIVATLVGQAADAPVGLADLETYRVALASPPDATAPLVQFRDLWDRPGTFTGRPVQIEGRLARIFRQPRLGDFPPLAEAWIVANSGDPFCVVFPDESRPQPTEIGSTVRFSGTFLRRIQYQGGDTSRVVPLIVGPRPPGERSRSTGIGRWTWTSVDWVMGLGATGLVILFLARRHFSRPVAPPAASVPHPVFIDGEPEPDVELADEKSH